jgi:hypothetical protein
VCHTWVISTGEAERPKQTKSYVLKQLYPRGWGKIDDLEVCPSMVGIRKNVEQLRRRVSWGDKGVSHQEGTSA